MCRALGPVMVSATVADNCYRGQRDNTLLAKKMKTSISILLSSLLLVTASAVEPEENYGLKYLKKLQVDGYTLTLDRVELHQGELNNGLFKFRWNGSKPVKIWGIRFDAEGAFRVIYENTALFDGERWTATNFGHCGTGAKLFVFEPGKEYTFRIPVWQFRSAEGEKGLVCIGGDTVSLISEPFLITTLKQAIAN